jgi:hypothetical protein
MRHISPSLLFAVGASAIMASCTPPPASPSPPPTITGVKDVFFSTWQQAAIAGSNRLIVLVDSGIGAGTGVNADSLGSATPDFGMLRLRVGFMKLVNADLAEPLDSVVADTFGLCGVMMNNASAAATIEVVRDQSGDWDILTMGDQRLTRQVNEIFTFVPASQVDSLVMFEVVNLHTTVIKVKVGPNTSFYSAYKSANGHFQQVTESNILKLLQADAAAFDAAHHAALVADTISG